MRVKKSRAVASFCACVLSMAVFSMGMIASAAAETVEGRIPVTCTGADCTAVLYNREGKERNRLEDKERRGRIYVLSG